MGKYSSDSDSDKRKSSYKSRSKRRSSSSSSSDSRSRKRRHNRSRSRDRYSKYSKSRRRSRSRSRHRDRHRRHRRSRSRSRSYIKEYTSKPRRRSTSSSSDSEPKNEEIVKNEAKRASPEVSKVDAKAVNAINEEGFTPKSFTSKSKKMMENIVIDLKKQTIKVPEVEPVEPDSIFHHNLFLNEEARMEKWIKELYGYRQRALQQGLKTGEK
ncbi:serine/Arginine-related protein 53 [Tribolium castaneum]|uniref:Uncharacterized protein n=1 Tax=Tribolium castaneum TaxID=7070 RepID=D6WJ31_TRICA|nr:PREDICTED: serine/Arginine-related protein 53 [Tribolium castaneum]EFA03874.1 hypothetical protein TcasGA2_TC013998 [Tribolium castaneum]|eukprot:XP_969545.1 PREDICTED: serine/Arginine-related protein 53 [Tribolium castaneum]